MIVYDKLFPLMKEKGLTTYKIRKDNIISQASWTSITHGKSITLETLDRLCDALDCQPGDILSFVRSDDSE